MATDSGFDNSPESINDFVSIIEAPMPHIERSSYAGYGLNIEDSSLNINLHNFVFPPSPGSRTRVEFLNDSEDIECLDDPESDSVFKFLSQILMEENMDEKPSMFHDPLALQATEKSFYEVIDKKYQPSPSIDYPAYFDEYTDCPRSLCERTRQANGSFVDPSCSGDPGSYQHYPLNGPIQSSVTSSQSLVHSVNSSRSRNGGEIDSFMNTNLDPSLFCENNEYMQQFHEGVKEFRKFLPANSELVVDLDKYTLAPEPEMEPPELEVKMGKDRSPGSRGRKHLHRQDSDLDTRSKKQSAVYDVEVELPELFDNVLLRDVEGVMVSSKGVVKFLNGIDKYWQQNGLVRGPRNGKAPKKKKGKECDVDLQSLLVSCAQAASSDDLRTAYEQLKQIRQYTSSTGDACQRAANVFANGLEARLAGTGTQIYDALAAKRISAVEKIKAYQVYISACPFKEISVVFANQMILMFAAKASTLHIVDFGISYGFQWPILIQFLSIRQGGPPKLRITGIDFPQAGFRPAELIVETGQRLAKYCKRFNVPFEYQAIARQSWETIDINDLELVRDEVLVVNSMLRFKDLPDETVVVDSPKDGVLKLIRKMKPDVFLHSIVNGSYNVPFFVTRFREAFFYYTSLFDMLDVTLPRDDLQRLHFEKEFYGREVVNIIACEGQQRVVRPETYKQWQIRSIRAGFKILPLDKEIVKKLKGKVEAGFHKDFLFDEDCNWMLQGWKGRILYGSSCWVPV